MPKKTLKFQVPRKLKPFLTKKKRYKIAYGGRGGSKSMTLADILLHLCAQYGEKIGCMREFQSSIADSSYSLLKDEASRIEIPGFEIQKTTISHASGGEFRFKGLARGIDSVKSMHGFNKFFIEEAQFLSEESIRILTPTLRADDSEYWFALNPGSSEDPVSVRFLNPFMAELEKNGYYEDDLHLIIKVNYDDNPFFPAILEQERKNDYKILNRALYDHIWLGMFNDSVENGLIKAEWFDACVDAHKKLGIKPEGIRFSSHDPSDEGPDSKGFAFRHGIVFTDIQEMLEGTVNEGCDWATGLAINHVSDAFTWDCDGMGAALKQQVSKSFEGKPTILSMFKGSEGVDNPDAIFEPVGEPIQNQITNKDALANKRAQYYLELRKKVYKTYEAVDRHVYHNPDDLISFDSGIEIMQRLRSELCRMPIKPNGAGKFELYTKQVMKDKFKFRSPNLADPVMMSCKIPYTQAVNTSYRPPPIKVMGRQ